MDLYQKEILKLAAHAVGHGTLGDLKEQSSHQDISYKSLIHRNPLCGDKITLHSAFKENFFTALTHETEACVLCQASASILGANFEGENLQEMIQIRDILKKSLDHKSLDKISDRLEEKWHILSIFQPVCDHKNRHTCVTLPFDAAVELMRLEKF